MTQPKFAPIAKADEVRPSYKLEAPRPWFPHRPADNPKAPRPRTRAGGIPGPDQGYALRLAEVIAPRVVLGPGEHLDDALAAGVALALRRAAAFGRAPVLGDLEFGLSALGYLGEVDPATQAARRDLVGGVAHDDFRQRELAESFPEDRLADRPNAVQGLLGAPERTGA